MSQAVPERETSVRAADARGRFAWALYDWANSPFTTLIITFVFPAYFARAIVGNETVGQSLWGYGVGVSGLLIAVMSPLFGAVADAGGRQKPFLLAFTLLCAAASALLWFAMPGPAMVVPVLICVGVANIGFEFGGVFNNAMLPEIVSGRRLGRLSGWAWGLGYLGGLAALVIALVGFVQNENPWLGLSTQQAEHVRIVGPLVAVWLVVFAWPVLLFTPEPGSRRVAIVQATMAGIRRLRHLVGELRDRPDIARFLLAHMIYADGLTTVFAFGGVYAAGVFDMSLGEVVQFGILLNVMAGAGAFGFAWLDDRLGSRRTIAIALVGIIAAATAAVSVQDRLSFWIAGAALGLFVGPAQASSRALMARLMPGDRRGEYFGLFALSGKATAFAGPILVGTLTALFSSQRAGLASVLAFFMVGLALLLTVREPSRA